MNDRTVVPGSQETRVPERGWVLATWLLATHAWISPAYARVNIVGSTLLPHPPVRANRIHVIAAAGWRFPLYLCLCFSFPYPKADSSSAAYTTGREYTTSHISTQTSPGSPSTSTRDIVTDSVQYNVSTTDLETSHVRWVCQLLARTPAATLEPRRHTNSANSSGVRCACTSAAFPATRRFRRRCSAAIFNSFHRHRNVFHFSSNFCFRFSFLFALSFFFCTRWMHGVYFRCSTRNLQSLQSVAREVASSTSLQRSIWDFGFDT